LHHAIEADVKGMPVNGKKGISALSGVVDLVEGFPVDYMQCVLKG